MVRPMKKKREKSDVELRLVLSKSFDDRVLAGKGE